MRPKMLQKRPHIRLRRRKQHPVPPLQKLRKGLQITQIRLARQRPKPLFHTQIRHILPHQAEIARRIHILDYPPG